MRECVVCVRACVRVCVCARARMCVYLFFRFRFFRGEEFRGERRSTLSTLVLLFQSVADKLIKFPDT